MYMYYRHVMDGQTDG